MSNDKTAALRALLDKAGLPGAADVVVCGDPRHVRDVVTAQADAALHVLGLPSAAEVREMRAEVERLRARRAREREDAVTTDTDLRAYLDAHGTDGAPTAPGWYVYLRTPPGRDPMLCVDFLRGFYLAPERITRHAPLRFAAPDEVARLTAERDAAVARAEKAEAENAALRAEVARMTDADGVAIGKYIREAMARRLGEDYAAELDALRTQVADLNRERDEARAGLASEKAEHAKTITYGGAFLDVLRRIRLMCEPINGSGYDGACQDEMVEAALHSLRQRAEHVEAWAVAALTRAADLEAELDALRPAPLTAAEVEYARGLAVGADLHRDIMARLRAEVPDPEGT